jgi:hypothetical protein
VNTPDSSKFLRAVIDANPSIILIFDEAMHIVASNKAADLFIGRNPTIVQDPKNGNTLNCINAADKDQGCGDLAHCSKCVIHNIAEKALMAHQKQRIRTRMTLIQDSEPSDYYFMITASPLYFEGKSLINVVLEDISEFMEMRALLPICAGCKKVRQDGEYWDSVETFMNKYLDLNFTHGLCPECADQLMNEVDQFNEQQNSE